MAYKITRERWVKVYEKWVDDTKDDRSEDDIFALLLATKETKKKSKVIDLGSYDEKDFPSREAMCAKIQEDAEKALDPSPQPEIEKLARPDGNYNMSEGYLWDKIDEVIDQVNKLTRQ